MRWIVVLALGLSLCFTTPALPHSWYDHDCCRADDCFAVANEDVEQTADGWKYLPTGNEFKDEKTMRRIRPSQDTFYHVCIGKRTWDKGKSYCIYILLGI